MGQTLEKPVTEKRFESGCGNSLKFAAVGMQGWRLDMEDAHTALPVFKENFGNASYYAVFDGHAGSYTSSVCAEKLHLQLYDTLIRKGFSTFPETLNEEEREKLADALAEGFVEFDASLRDSEPYTSGREACGTTALCCIITQNFVIFCNTGDSRGFLARNGNVYFQTKDHKPSDQTERQRIEASGGSVIMDRVNGNLAVSRAIGDFGFKDKPDLDLRHQAVSPEPTVTIIDREKEDFIVLACDGIWDVMSCEKVRDFIHLKMLITEDLSEIASDLVNACLILDSRDNMTCMIISFPDAPVVDQTEIGANNVYLEEIKQKLAEYAEKSEKGTTVIGAVEFLSSLTFTESAASKLGAQSQIKFIEDYLDELVPDRNKEKDYTQAQMLSSFPVSFQAIQQLVRREPMNLSSPESPSQEGISDDIETDDISENNN